MTLVDKMAEAGRALRLHAALMVPGMRVAIAHEADIQEKRAKAEAIGFDIEPVLEDAKTISRETPLAWETIWPEVWARAWTAACQGLTPPRVTIRWDPAFGWALEDAT